jgi:hypothetical protein
MQRQVTNRLLRGEGYIWKKFENDEEDQDMQGAPAFEWTLYSADGRVVSVSEAMQELAYAGKAFAKEWLASRNISEETPKIEMERQKKKHVEDAQRAKQAEKEKYIDDLTNEIIRHGFSHEQARSKAITLSDAYAHSEYDMQITEPERIDEDDLFVVTLDSDIRYGVMIGKHWRGINYMLRLHDILVEKYELLLELSQRNRELHP